MNDCLAEHLDAMSILMKQWLWVPQCKVLGARWHVKSRHKAGEVTLANLWYPQQWLFRREWLVVNAAP